MAKISKFTKVSVIASFTEREGSSLLSAVGIALNNTSRSNDTEYLKDLRAIRKALKDAGVKE